MLYSDQNNCVFSKIRMISFCFNLDPAAPLNIFHGNPAFSSKKSPLQHIDGSSTFLVKGNGSMLVFAQVSI